ncbi:hypothetical protein MKW92_010329 [Papaver armeniacum]|nr:hypothetical protein MKW92_010329 [Papaver armeniacum]
MALSLGGALELLDQILNLKDEVYDVNDKQYREKYELKKKYKDKLRWDEKNGPERPFNERSEIVESIPDFWTTALLAAIGSSVDVNYHGDAKSGYTIYPDMNINQDSIIYASQRHSSSPRRNH